MNLKEMLKCPAPVGMIPHAFLVEPVRVKMPRTCGDDPNVKVTHCVRHCKCPAPAGMIPTEITNMRAKEEMPRTCGDDPNRGREWVKPLINAPHLRG